MGCLFLPVVEYNISEFITRSDEFLKICKDQTSKKEENIKACVNV